ncbi:hypothetical protein H4R34_004787 [Dimargaris verticillata]|uniref:Spc98 family-domain-containing protein n=1 Tax=Dimargaris verticillata TaxID=2761393 RepID=A0A9W8AZH3_9FUNG|nr:hypothetical protein H4R34_004787 [Dimargaris verticillata]
MASIRPAAERPSMGLLTDDLAPVTPYLLPRLNLHVPKSIVPTVSPQGSTPPVLVPAPLSESSQPASTSSTAATEPTTLDPHPTKASAAVWDAALAATPVGNPLFSWDNTRTPRYQLPRSVASPAEVGGAVEPPQYLAERCTDAGFSALYLHRFSVQSLELEVDPVTVTEAQLLDAVALVLQGVDTALVKYDEDRTQFTLTHPRLRLSQSSPEALRRHLQPLLRCASTLRQLAHVGQVLRHGVTEWGQTGCAFSLALTDYLVVVHRSITRTYETLRYNGQLTLTSLYYRIANVDAVIRFLGQLCFCGPWQTHPTPLMGAPLACYQRHGFYLPGGSHLVTYLYDQLQRVQITHTLEIVPAVLTALLVRTSQPFFQWLEGWVGLANDSIDHGTRIDPLHRQIALDPFGEFLWAYPSEARAMTTSRNFWKQQPRLAPLRWPQSPSIPQLPGFMSRSLATSLIRIGHVLNWMRCHHPDHPLFSRLATPALWGRRGRSAAFLDDVVILQWTEMDHQQARLIGLLAQRLYTLLPSDTARRVLAAVDSAAGLMSPCTTTKLVPSLPVPPQTMLQYQALFNAQFNSAELPPRQLIPQLTQEQQVATEVLKHRRLATDASDWQPPVALHAASQLTAVLTDQCRFLDGVTFCWYFHALHLATHIQRLMTACLLQDGPFKLDLDQLLFTELPQYVQDRQAYRLQRLARPSRRSRESKGFEAAYSPIKDSTTPSPDAKRSNSHSYDPSPTKGSHHHPYWNYYYYARRRLMELTQTTTDFASLAPLQMHRASRTPLTPPTLDRYFLFSLGFKADSEEYINPLSPGAFDFVHLQYHTPPALAVLLTPTLLDRYDTIFGFMVQLNWVSFAVTRLSRRLLTSSFMRLYRSYTYRRTPLNTADVAATPADPPSPAAAAVAYIVAVSRLHIEVRQFVNALNHYILNVVFGRTVQGFFGVLTNINAQLTAWVAQVAELATATTVGANGQGPRDGPVTASIDALPGDLYDRLVQIQPAFPSIVDFHVYHKSVLDAVLYLLFQKRARLLYKTLISVFDVILKFCKRVDTDLQLLDSLVLPRSRPSSKQMPHSSPFVDAAKAVVGTHLPGGSSDTWVTLVEHATGLHEEFGIEHSAFCQTLIKAAMRRPEIEPILPSPLRAFLAHRSAASAGTTTTTPQGDQNFGYHPFMDLLAHLDFADHYRQQAWAD